LSLHRQLLLWVLFPQLVLLLVGGGLAYRMAVSYASKAIDQSLTQTVQALARQVKPIGSGLLVDFPKAAQAIIEQDPQDRLSYMVSSPPGRFLLGNRHLSDPPADLGDSAGRVRLYDAAVEGQPMRLAVLELDYGEPSAPQRLRVQVAQSQSLQNRLTHELIADLLLPMALLGVVLSALVYGGIRRGLQPLLRLQDQLGRLGQASPATNSAALSPIELTQAPREVLALATALNDLLATVRRSLGQEKRFLNDAAHQLRTPLAGLVSQTELALAETDPQALRARLHKVLAGAQRSAHLVHQLLALARHEADVCLRPLDLADLARGVAREHTQRALQAGVDLGFEGPQQCPIQGEPLLLREALSNLLDNALLYGGSGCEVTVRLQTEAPEAADGGVVLAVEDTGPGIPAEELPRVFQRFWRGSDQAGGCGLGLAIVAEVAQRHGGQAHASLLQPHGLRIAIRLPVQPR